MNKMYKFRAYPNKKQREQMEKTFNCTRFVYNYYLAKQIDLYQTEKGHMTYYDMCNDITVIKKEYTWLKESDSVALFQAVKILDNSYNRYFMEMKKPGYVRYSPEKLQRFKEINHIPTLYDSAWHPKFKKRTNHRKTYITENYYPNKDKEWSTIMYKDGEIRIPKLGWVKIRDNCSPIGKIKCATVIKEASEKYYFCICCSIDNVVSFPKTNKQIGVDLGVKNFCTLSNGEKYDFVIDEKLKNKINRLQKELDRRTVGGENWEKTRIKLARLYEKISNQKTDYLHKLSTSLIKNYDVICIEDLDVEGIKKDALGNKTKKAIFRMRVDDTSMSTFSNMLKYKSEWYGKKLVKIDQYYPSSQICHICGYRNNETKNTKMREWTCPSCGTYHDRDVNAAINILNEGLKQISK